MPDNFPINWPKALSEMEEDRNGWRACHDRLFQENKRLRAALAPILAHADNPDTAPPLRISVRQAREIKGQVNA